MKFVIIILLLTVTMMVTPVLAEDATQSADIQQKLDALKQEIASKAASLKKEVSQKLENRAFIGSIKSIDNTTITIDSLSREKQIRTTADTNAPKKMKQDDYIIALGDVDDKGMLVAKKIVLLSNTNTKPQKIALWGQVSDISGSIITIKDANQKDIRILATGKTDFKKGSDDIDLSAIIVGDTIIASGYQNDKFQATFIFVYPK